MKIDCFPGSIVALIKSGRSLTMKVKHMHGRQTEIHHGFNSLGETIWLGKRTTLTRTTH